MESSNTGNTLQRVPVIVGDIGGTNSRLSIIKMSSAIDDEGSVIDYKILVSIKYESIEAIITEYLKPFQGTAYYPIYGAIAVAAPVVNNTVKMMTNVSFWPKANGDEIGKKLGLQKLQFINDFVSHGYVVDSRLIEGKDYVYINNKPMNPQGQKALMGPGTGMGVGLLAKGHFSNYYEIVPSEGTHQDFPVKTQMEFDYMKFIQNLYQVDHVSIERAVSGLSICAMYKFLYDYENLEPEPNLKQRIDKLENIIANNEEAMEIRKEIFRLGLTKKCPCCRRVIEFFVGLLGDMAGNYSLMTLCTGGLYLIGGICNTLEQVLKDENIFMEHFTGKGRFKAITQNIPVILIKDFDTGTRGSKEYVRRIIESNEK